MQHNPTAICRAGQAGKSYQADYFNLDITNSSREGAKVAKNGK